ncbi:MAG TPA: AI-2E family transporter [Patescibacteria group bacterium]
MIQFPKDTHGVVISPYSIIFTIFFGLFLYFLYLVRSIVVIVFLSFIIMTALNPAVAKVHKYTKLPRGISIIIVYLLFLTLLIGMFGFLLPPIINEFYQLVKNVQLPVLADEVRNLNFTVGELSSLAGRVSDQVGQIFSVISSTFSGLVTMFTLIVLSAYLILDRPYLHRKIFWFTHQEKHLQEAKEFLDSLEHQLGGWVRGQLILMTVIGVITYIGLSLLSIPYALPLAVLAGILEILPNLGPTIAAVPAIILALVMLGWPMAAATAVFYIVVQQLENYVIVPKIMRDNVDVNPVVTIVTILIGLQLGGVVGALLAVPVYIVLRTIYAKFFRP